MGSLDNAKHKPEGFMFGIFSSVYAPLHKKRKIKNLKNYCPMTLLSVAYKLFSKIIANKIANTLIARQHREQAGCTSRFSTTDRTHSAN